MVAMQSFIGPALPPDWDVVPPSTESRAVESYGGLTGLQTQTDGRLQLEMEFNPEGDIDCGHGLTNLGNSCFMAATLQCLTHLAPLARLCLSEAHQKACIKTRDPKGFCSACGLFNRIRAGLTRAGIMRPLNMWSHLEDYAEHFTKGQQEDAHEFLICCLDAVERACFDLFKRLSDLPIKSGQEPKTEVPEIFGGVTRSRVTCAACHTVSDKLDPCYDLSLDLQGCRSVHDALHRFTTTDKLEGANLYNCEKCKRHVVAEKRVTVHQSPNALVLHLQRFSLLAKINQRIDFPAELDLGPCLSSDAAELDELPRQRAADAGARPVPECKYHLSGVIVHRGWSVHAGHYYAFVRPHRGGQWWLMDDDNVRQVQWPDVHGEHAYVLFYVRDTQRGTSAAQADPPSSPPGTPAVAPIPGPKRSWSSHDSHDNPDPPSPKRPRATAQSALAAENGHDSAMGQVAPDEVEEGELPSAAQTAKGPAQTASSPAVRPAENGHAQAPHRTDHDPSPADVPPPPPARPAADRADAATTGQSSRADAQQQQQNGTHDSAQRQPGPAPAAAARQKLPAPDFSKWEAGAMQQPRNQQPERPEGLGSRPVSFSLGRPRPSVLKRMQADGEGSSPRAGTQNRPAPHQHNALHASGQQRQTFKPRAPLDTMYSPMERQLPSIPATAPKIRPPGRWQPPVIGGMGLLSRGDRMQQEAARQYRSKANGSSWR